MQSSQTQVNMLLKFSNYKEPMPNFIRLLLLILIFYPQFNKLNYGLTTKLTFLLILIYFQIFFCFIYLNQLNNILFIMLIVYFILKLKTFAKLLFIFIRQVNFQKSFNLTIRDLIFELFTKKHIINMVHYYLKT